MNRQDPTPPGTHKAARAPSVGAEEMLRVLTHSVGATVAVIGRDLRFVYANEEFATWLDMTPEQLRGRAMRDVYGEYNHARYMPFVERVLQGEKVNYQRQVRSPAGVDEWRTICLSPWRDDSGEVVGFVASSLDVHELKATTEALHTANQRLSSHMDNSPLAVIEMNRELCLEHHSHRTCELLGWSQTDLRGQSVLALLHAEQEDNAPLRLALRRLQRREETRNRVEATHRRPDGTLVHCEWFNSALTDARGEVESIMSLVEDVTAKVQAAQRLHFMVQHDALTGLLNRMAFHERVETALMRARRTGQSVAVLFIDLDGFKSVNDAFGHATGDLVLRDAARRLAQAVRETDTVARIGGDEFVVLLDTEVQPGTPAAVCQRVLLALQQPFCLPEGRQCELGASIGVARHPPAEGQADRLLNRADQAMYEAKRAGRGCVREAMLPG